ncbi:hypothetical protein F5877DRAFT_73536, partial [Lentinula edodes]
WLNRPTFIFLHAKTLTIGVTFDNAGRFQHAMEHSGLLGKWRSFTPILAQFSNLTHLEFIFLVLPRTFPVVLSSLPKMTNLVLKSCVFDGPVSFYGVKLRLLQLTLHNICWDESPDEGNLLRGCPLLRVLFLSWHYRIAQTLNADCLRKLSGTLYDLTVTSATYSWSTDRQQRLEQNRRGVSARQAAISSAIAVVLRTYPFLPRSSSASYWLKFQNVEDFQIDTAHVPVFGAVGMDTTVFPEQSPPPAVNPNDNHPSFTSGSGYMRTRNGERLTFDTVVIQKYAISWYSLTTKPSPSKYVHHVPSFSIIQELADEVAVKLRKYYGSQGTSDFLNIANNVLNF